MAPQQQSTPTANSPGGPDDRGPYRRWVALALGAALALITVFALWWHGALPPAPRAGAGAPATYVGSTSCQACHAGEYGAWSASHHAAAMAEANEQSVKGDFADRKFASDGVSAVFSRAGSEYRVRTDGVDGKPADFTIKYTFGVAPLQQYLIELPGGRLQALSIAWDTRPKAEGGQRWFFLYPGQHIGPKDPLHWTGLQQNWNYMCADCHSTDLKKNYDAASSTFHSSWSEISVGCEACHGPASGHLEWARAHPKPARPGETAYGEGKGFELQFDERRGVTWIPDAATGISARSEPRSSTREIGACAQCHSRRGQLIDRHFPGRPIGEGYRVALLEEGLYWPDGQTRDEVYVHGSFLQSKMYAKGVTCSDCHEPHSGGLRAKGNALCAQCHEPARFDVTAHTHHPPGSTGAQCTACHMPATTYMVVNPRPDHSLRVPRPQDTMAFGVPNACNGCHSERTAQWSLAALNAWNGHPPSGFQNFGAAFHAAEHGAADARDRLLGVIADPTSPAIVRASALGRLAGDRSPAVTAAASLATHDPDEFVRRAAVEVLSDSEPALRVRELAPLAADPVRAVRIEAARALAGAPPSAIPESERATLERATQDYVAAQLYNADRPEAHANLGGFYAERGDFERARASYRKALSLAPDATPAVLGLADLYRRHGDDPAAARTLEAGLGAQPKAAELKLALGLSYVRQGRNGEALALLKAAASDAPNEPSYAYYYGVALNSYGQTAEATHILRVAHRRFPGNGEILKTLVLIERDSGDRQAARTDAEALVGLGNDGEAQALLDSLR